MTRDFVVVGGGVGGLVVARDLAAAGAQVTLLEATDRLGGQVRRHTVGGIDLDAGAEAFAVRADAVQKLATVLGLGGDIVAPAPAGAWLQRATAAPLPLPATSLLGIPGSPLAADVIAVVGGATAFRAYLESAAAGTVGAKAANARRTGAQPDGRAASSRSSSPRSSPACTARTPTTCRSTGLPLACGTRLLREGSLARGVRDLREQGAGRLRGDGHPRRDGAARRRAHRRPRPVRRRRAPRRRRIDVTATSVRVGREPPHRASDRRGARCARRRPFSGAPWSPPSSSMPRRSTPLRAARGCSSRPGLPASVRAR